MRQSAERKPANLNANPSALTIAGTAREVRAHVARWRAAGETVALIPTMGALHAGHLALLTRAQHLAKRTIVSIFVNPTQFAPSEDLDRYPRTFETDRTLLDEAGADLIFAPTAQEMYPSGFATRITVGGPADVGLEDAARPHFFGGVATVVAKLLLVSSPDVALFGEKDYQQLCVVNTVVRDLGIPVAIAPVPTVREDDGLAMSSRNRFLTPDERRRAPIVMGALSEAAAMIRRGRGTDAALARGREALAGEGFAIDYFEVRHAATLAPVADVASEPLRLLVAARIGSVRLIDNIAV